jgi:hypothetical protein
MKSGFAALEQLPQSATLMNESRCLLYMAIPRNRLA